MTEPYEPKAPIVQAKLDAVLGELAETEDGMPALVLASVAEEGKPGAAARIRIQRQKIDAANRAVTELSAALLLAKQADRDADAARIEEARALSPEVACAGISARSCPTRCTKDSCALAGGLNICVHPRGSGVPPQHQGDQVVRRFHYAAAAAVRQQELEKQFQGAAS